MSNVEIYIEDNSVFFYLDVHGVLENNKFHASAALLICFPSFLGGIAHVL